MKYTQKELNYLEANGTRLSPNQIAKHLRRSTKAIQSKLYDLKKRKTPMVKPPRKPVIKPTPGVKKGLPDLILHAATLNLVELLNKAVDLYSEFRYLWDGFLSTIPDKDFQKKLKSQNDRLKK